MQTITAMRQAFMNARVTKQTGAAVVNACAKALLYDGGVIRHADKWNASLSFKSAQQLKANEGWNFPFLPVTAYDRMVEENTRISLV
jgi:hypothetical protein